MKETSKEYLDFAVFKCLPYENGLKFWCPFCKAWHHHGVGEGHRVEHCSYQVGKTPLPSPFKKEGYVITEMTTTELKETRRDIEREIAKRERAKKESEI